MLLNTLQICPPVNPKKSFSTELCLFIHNSDYLCYIRRTNCNQLATPLKNVTTLTCELQNFFISREGLLRSFKRWRLWREPVVGCRRWLWKEPVVVCGNWNVMQAVSQQVFRVTDRWRRNGIIVHSCSLSFVMKIKLPLQLRVARTSCWPPFLTET